MVNVLHILARVAALFYNPFTTPHAMRQNLTLAIPTDPIYVLPIPEQILALQVRHNSTYLCSKHIRQAQSECYRASNAMEQAYTASCKPYTSEYCVERENMARKAESDLRMKCDALGDAAREVEKEQWAVGMKIEELQGGKMAKKLRKMKCCE